MKPLDKNPPPGTLRVMSVPMTQWATMFEGGDLQEAGQLHRGDVVFVLGTAWEGYINVLTKWGKGTIHISGFWDKK